MKTFKRCLAVVMLIACVASFLVFPVAAETEEIEPRIALMKCPSCGGGIPNTPTARFVPKEIDRFSVGDHDHIIYGAYDIYTCQDCGYQSWHCIRVDEVCTKN